ncbi:MAG TPA: VanZ family protein [Geminicoccaceae bacterium]|nr:VanZ family protein [Geminicoccaceae bacterium]
MIYAAGLLWPFAIQVPTWVANDAAWSSAGTLRFESPGLAVSPAPPRWQGTSRDRSRFHVSLRARAFSPQQDGPARLFTLARDTHAQNVVIGQAGDDLVVRLRGLCRGFRAHATACPKQLRIPNVFATSEWVDIDLLVEPNRAMLRAGNRPPLEMWVADQPLRGWDAEHRLALGNDVSGLRPWLGELERVTIETPLGSEDWLDPARLELPDGFWLLDRQPKLFPFYHVSRGDVIVNLLLYVPLAILMAGCFSIFGRSQFLFTVLFVLMVSSIFEFAQLFVETRNFSATDIFLNTMGGTAISYLIYIYSVGHRR